jgi:hypothetical protein
MAKVAKTLRSLGDHLQVGASVRNVYGDPVNVGGRTVIPIARVSYGFGVGESEEDRSERAGSGTGGGLSARPGRRARDHRGRNALHSVHRPGASWHCTRGRMPDRPRDRSPIGQCEGARREMKGPEVSPGPHVGKESGPL